MIFIEKQKKIIENMFRVSEGVNPSMVGGGGALGHAGVHKVLKSSILSRTIAKPVLSKSIQYNTCMHHTLLDPVRLHT